LHEIVYEHRLATDHLLLAKPPLLLHRKDKRNTYSRRRKYHADKDVDFINDRNAHFNKKIDRAFGQYTQETKANLERGTALPDH